MEVFGMLLIKWWNKKLTQRRRDTEQTKIFKHLIHASQNSHPLRASAPLREKNHKIPIMAATSDIVQKLWNLCHVLRDDGVTYLQYVTELTYLLFLKMAQETGAEAQLPEGYRWGNLVSKDGVEQLTFYRSLLLMLGSEDSSLRVQAIFANAQTSLKQPRILNKLVTSIDELDWFSEHRDEFGDLYEGLLQKNADEKKSGAGQ